MTTWPVTRFRDLTLISAPGDHVVVVACDSVGGIGAKPHDTFEIGMRTVTHFAARVPLLEVICAGATVSVIVDTLSVEKSPSGTDMIDEIRRMAADLGLDPDAAVTGSTEDNVPTVATGLGVTVVGHAKRSDLNVGKVRSGDHIYAIGQPLSAPRDRLVPGDPRMPSIGEVAELARNRQVRELLPVGSKGTGYEIGELVRNSQLEYILTNNPSHDLALTSGPSTCVLAAVDPAAAQVLRLREDLPITHVATATTPKGL